MPKESAAVGAVLFLPRYWGARGPKEQKFLRRFFQKAALFLTSENKNPAKAGFFQKRVSRRQGLALTGLHPRVLLVDDVDPAMATHDAAILVASFRGFQGVTDLHHKLSGKMFIEMARYAGRRRQCQPADDRFRCHERVIRLRLQSLVESQTAPNAADSPRSRERL
jgi:hypothetical protein